MTTVRIVQQPAVASVVLFDDEGKPVHIMYQHTRERCEGYVHCLIDGPTGFFQCEVLDAIECAAGNCIELLSAK